MARSLFNSSSSRDLFQQPYAQAGGSPPIHGRGEIDLREELDEFFFGYKSGIRHGGFILIRRMDRDSQGKRVPCTCRVEFTREPDPSCSFCLGEGYNWHEDWVWSYSTYGDGLISKVVSMPPGALRVDYKVFYLRYDANVLYGDKIVEVRLDENGQITLPFIRESIYQPQTIARFRSDNSRTEYIAVYCRENDALRLDYPVE